MKKLRSELLRFGAAAGAFAAVSTPHAAQAQEATLALEEIVVTAQRRSETLQDVPIAVTAITADDLATRDIRDYSTYLASVPGAAFQETTGIGGEIKFRGIGTGINAQMSPTTAVYFGDVPVIHTGRNVNSSYNFFLSDIERIEVLRGPQGQLYGSNSLGGAIKNVPAAPELGEFGARVELGGASIDEGGNDYNAQGMLNIPMGESAALRLVAYSAEQGGWYDNVYTGGPRLGSIITPLLPPQAIGAPGQALDEIIALNPAVANYAAPAPSEREDVNEIETTGGRAILKWQPSDALSTTLMAVYEKKEYGGAMFAEYPNELTFIDTALGLPFTIAPQVFTDIDYENYQHHEAVTGGGGDEIELVNLVIDYNFGGATLTSSTSYWERTEELDLSISISTFPITGLPESVPIINDRTDNPTVITQEFRLTSNNEGRLDWLVGAFWQEIDQDHRVFAQDLSGLDLAYYRQIVLSQAAPFLFAPPNTRVMADNRANYKDEQIAVFGQLGFDFTDKWRAAVSARWFTLDQEFSAESLGFQFGFAQGAQSGENDEDVFTPRVEVSYKPNEDQLWYASAAEGFRTGIINRDIPRTPTTCGGELAAIGYPDGVPPTEADTTRNYELGTKIEFGGGRARLNAALYYIDWQDMQLSIPLSSFAPPGLPSFCQYDAVFNVGDATSQGAELEFSARLSDSLLFDTAISYTNAEFDTDIPQLGIFSGTDIPLTAEMTLFTSLQWNFDFATRPAYLRAEWQYVGEKSPFTQDFPVSQYPDGVPYTIGDYEQYNLRAAVDLTDSITFSLFGDNLTNEFGITSSNSTGGIGFPFITTIRPRTYGANVRVRF